MAHNGGGTNSTTMRQAVQVVFLLDHSTALACRGQSVHNQKLAHPGGHQW